MARKVAALPRFTNFLYALDAHTGKPVPSFGENGRIDLRKDLRGDCQAQSVAMTSPGMVYKDRIIVVGVIPKHILPHPGDIRAFDVRTGELRWRFHTIPHPGEFGYETWPKDAWRYSGAANNWAGMSLDAERGIVCPHGIARIRFLRQPIGLGSENHGGPIVTAGDVLFIGATVYDKKFRAFDSLTGKLLWETVLPNSAIATPATYMIDGKQYVVVSAGGGKDPKGSSGSVYVAFALP
jgi:glucose dehydrogenase